MNRQEAHTIIVALRMLQDHLDSQFTGQHGIGDFDWSKPPLTTKEIDALCDTLEIEAQP